MPRLKEVIPQPRPEPRACATQKSAAALAARCGAPNADARGEWDARAACWRPVVVLRPDQAWMVPHVEERGVVARVLPR